MIITKMEKQYQFQRIAYNSEYLCLQETPVVLVF